MEIISNMMEFVGDAISKYHGKSVPENDFALGENSFFSLVRYKWISGLYLQKCKSVVSTLGLPIPGLESLD